MKPLRQLGVQVRVWKRVGPARIVSVLASAALAALMLLAPAASALSTTPLPFTAFGAVALDTVHGKVYVSGGRLDSRIALLSTTGQLEKTLSNLPGASGLAFDPSYSTLYVSLSSAEIAAIDTSTGSVRGRFSVSPFMPNGQMAYAGGRLWFGQSCGDKWAPIVHVNPDGSGLGVGGPSRYCPTFAAAPAHPELLAVSERGLSPVDADLYRVDNGGFTLQASTSGRPFSNLQNLAFNSSATTLYGASGAPYEIQSFGLPGLAQSVSFGVGAYPRAVAAGGDSYLAAGRSGVSNTITVYASGNPSPLRTIELPAGREIAAGGLVFVGPTTLLAVTAPIGGGTLSAHVFADVTTQPTQGSTSAAPKIRPSVADQAYARSHLLRKGDLPAGRWSVKPPSTSHSDEPEPACAKHYSLSALTATADASVTYVLPGGLPLIDSGAIVFVSSGDAKRAFAIQSKVGFGRCIGSIIVAALRPRIAIKLGTVKAVSAGSARGFRIPLTIRSSQGKASFEQVILNVRHERTLGTLMLLRTNSSWPQTTLRVLVNKAVRRLKGS